MNGCYNRKPYRDSYAVHGISKETGKLVATEIKFRMEKTCQYTLTDLGQTDPKCNGCKHKHENR